MIIDLSNYRLKEDICDVSGDDPTTLPVIKPSDILIGGNSMGAFMAFTTGNKPSYNPMPIPGVQLCRYELRPEEIGLASYYEIYQTLRTAFGITEEELVANDGYMDFPISSIKLGDDVFNATSAWVDVTERHLDAQIVGQTFTIKLFLNFRDPNLMSLSEGGTFEQSFKVDIIR